MKDNINKKYLWDIKSVFYKRAFKMTKMQNFRIFKKDVYCRV